MQKNKLDLNHLLNAPPKDFLNLAYQALLDRDIDPEGNQTYFPLLIHGWSHSFIIRAICKSIEFQKLKPHFIPQVNKFISAYNKAQQKNLFGLFYRSVKCIETDFPDSRLARSFLRHTAQELIIPSTISNGLGSDEYVPDELIDTAKLISHRTIRDIVKMSLTHSTKNIDQLTINPNAFHVFQYWDSPVIPTDVLTIMDEWKAAYSENYTRFSELQALLFIKQNFPIDYANAYQKCWHPAMKADFFRLCYLYKNGGCYVDADEGVRFDEDDGASLKIPLIDIHHNGDFLILRPIIRADYGDGFVTIPFNEFVINFDKHTDAQCYFNNAPIICSPQNEIIRLALTRSKKLILGPEINHMSLHDITGPSNLSFCIIAHLLHSSFAGLKPVNVIAIDWSLYSRDVDFLQYKNDNRYWGLQEYLNSANPQHT